MILVNNPLSYLTFDNTGFNNGLPGLQNYLKVPEGTWPFQFNKHELCLKRLDIIFDLNNGTMYISESHFVILSITTTVMLRLLSAMLYKTYCIIHHVHSYA